MSTGLLRTLVMSGLMLALAASVRAQEGQTTSSDASATSRDRQPLWTTRPPFGDTHVYVVPKGDAVFAFGLQPITAADGSTTTDSVYRVEFGLPARVQIGLHATGRAEGHDGVIGNIDAQALEVRWAFADWGTAWGNPTLLVGWREASRGADVGSVRLLFGGGFGSAWRWGSNVGWSQAASGPRDVDRAWTTGVSYATGRVASIGFETRVALAERHTAATGTDTSITRGLAAGPSIQIRPVRRLSIDLAMLVGASTGSPRSRATLAAGWEF